MNIFPLEDELDEIDEIVAVLGGMLVYWVNLAHQQTLHMQQGVLQISGRQLTSVVAPTVPGLVVTMLMVEVLTMSS